jgi:uncharacterized membrane protein
MCYAGIGACLWARGTTRGALSRFLLTRGLWIVLLGLTVERFNLFFNLNYDLIVLVTLWAIGCSMVALSAMVWLGDRALIAVSVAMILLHNLLDGIRPARFGSAAWVWNILHQPGPLPLDGHVVMAGYPLVPWIGVMGLGYGLGKVCLLEPERRRVLLMRIGAGMTAAFVVVRAINIYGNPTAWSVQRSAVFTVLSFLNCTKYPPSLDFLLMTLGPALMLTAWLDPRPLARTNPLLVYGRTPMFYYLVHFFLIHAAAAIADWALTGRTVLFSHAPASMGTSALDPYGYPLWVCYLVWIAVVAALYPACRWYGDLKQRRKDWWLSYL